MKATEENAPPPSLLRAEGYHRVAVAQIDYNPAFVINGQSYIEEPWPQDSGPLPFTSIELTINDSWYPRLLTIRREVSRLYTEMFVRRLDAIIDFCGSLRTEFLIFPEYSIPPTLLKHLQARACHLGMTIIAGTHLVTSEVVNSGVYRDLGVDEPEIGSSVAPVLGAEANALVPKLTLSQWELDKLKDIKGWRPIDCRNGLRFGVLVCLDLLDVEGFFNGGYILFEDHHPFWVRTCAYSPNGTRFVTGCRDGKDRFFNPPS